MAASVYAHSCFVRSTEIYLNLRNTITSVLLWIFYIYFHITWYVCTYTMFFSLRLYVRIFSDLLQFCREWFSLNFSRLTLVFNWSKYIYILYINRNCKHLITFVPLNYDGTQRKNQFGNFTEIIANYYSLHLPYFVRSVDIFYRRYKNNIKLTKFVNLEVLLEGTFRRLEYMSH